MFLTALQISRTPVRDYVRESRTPYMQHREFRLILVPSKAGLLCPYAKTVLRLAKSQDKTIRTYSLVNSFRSSLIEKAFLSPSEIKPLSEFWALPLQTIHLECIAKF
jgi:hypothetical protein